MNNFLPIIETMKQRSVKIKIIQLLKRYGSRESLANELWVSTRYIHYLEKGRIPGQRLYRDICQLYQDSM